ncbi:transmembrane proteins 14C-domain-containing protein [Tricharina praecox]|uniref:transmembrane proteins 14C-domain-containing protein n=1 Tax=Tricharina praecox TaxID=43433 RepID=UPI00221FC728|nr:transmembrane proteins 14C-domain-containing protein [Tricharina praecox]KAI5846967.1 transmembrane proteins 14C-domain-containing protein [Tricharina praecox]
MADLPALILGLLCAFGGTMGYVRTGSVPSLVAGMGVGALYTYGGLRIRNGQPYGVETALLASLVLAGSSFPRAVKTGKPLPIGLSVLATYGLFYYGMKYKNAARL